MICFLFVASTRKVYQRKLHKLLTEGDTVVFRLQKVESRHSPS